MYTYAVPQVDRVSFVSLAQTDVLHAEVVHTSQLRARVEQCLHSREPLAIVQAVSEYLPYLLGLYDCVLRDTILLRDDVHLTWRSMLVSSKFRLHGLLSEGVPDAYAVCVFFACRGSDDRRGPRCLRTGCS